MNLSTFFKLSFCLLIASILFLTGCSKDGEANTISIVGKWKENPKVEQRTYTFKPEGLGSFFISCNDEEEYFTYIFDSKTNKITGVWDYGREDCYVKFISKTSIQLYEDALYKKEITEVMSKQ